MSESIGSGAMEMISNPEVKETYNYTYIGRLGDLGLGSENGIASSLETDEQVHEYARAYVQCLAAESADISRVACIDGRKGDGFEDGSEYVPLDRTAGGTFSDYVMAKAGQADIVSLTSATSIIEETDEVEASIGKIVGTAGKCSHGKGCGACNRAVEHSLTAATDAVQTATNAVMDMPAVQAVTGVRYDSVIADQTKIAFVELAGELEAKNYNGSAYTERAMQTNPQGVERLAGEAEQPHHGHKEQAIEIVADAFAVPDERLMDQEGLDDAFGFTLGRVVRVADALAGQKGINGKTQAVISGIAWNIAVGSNLCHPSMPIIVVSKS